MLSKCFRSAARIREIRNGEAGELIEEFVGVCFQRGYAEITARRHIRCAEHIVRRAGLKGVPISELDTGTLRRFGRHLSRCRCGRYACAAQQDILGGARLFLQHLQGIDESQTIERTRTAKDPALLVEFRKWMREQRGTHDRTLDNYSIPIRGLLQNCGGNPQRINARRLRQFVLSQGRTASPTIARRWTTALRMFLRFLIAEGHCRPGLLGAIPTLANWRLATLPRYLPPEDIQRIIDSCDITSPIGKRDRAILLLLARLGLRAGDIARMRLQDIDWKGAWIHVSGKSRTQARLPLSQEVGQAIVSYLREARPSVSTDVLFIRCHAPFRGLKSYSAFSVIVAKAMRRAGIQKPSRGAAHLLRHSIASSMLRHGASLQDISALLRHRSVETTAIYAKIDVRSLQQIAQPWPEVQSC